MAIDIDTYLTSMDELQSNAASALRTARKRVSMREQMQKIADDAGDQGVALTADQKAALLSEQQALTLALRPLLDAALVAIDPAQ